MVLPQLVSFLVDHLKTISRSISSTLVEYSLAHETVLTLPVVFRQCVSATLVLDIVCVALLCQAVPVMHYFRIQVKDKLRR